MENHFHSLFFLVLAWCIQLHPPPGLFGDLGANEQNLLKQVKYILLFACEEKV